MQLRWAEVTQITPSVEVRFVGDNTDIPVALKIDGYTATVNDKVMMARLGSSAGWVIVGELVST